MQDEHKLERVPRRAPLSVLVVALVAPGCAKSDCKKLADKMVECHVSYGPLIINDKSQVTAQLEGHCDAAMDSGDENMKKRAACVIAAGTCEEVEACF